MTRFLRLGLLAGALGGLAFALFLRLVGEGPIGRAVALESAASGATAHDELFSRAAQRIGGMIGAALYGVCLGAIVAVVFAAVRHRLAAADDWRRAVRFAAVGLLTVSLVPFLKYPANPPGVGDPDTITRRTTLYLVMLGWSVLATLAAWLASDRLRARGAGDAARVPIVVLAYTALVSAGLVLLPPVTDPVRLPATLVWQFRLTSLGGAVVLWTVLGLSFGWLLVRTTPLGRLSAGASATEAADA